MAAIGMVSAVAAAGCGSSTEPAAEAVPASVTLEYHGGVAPEKLLVRRGDVFELELVVRDAAGVRLRSRQIELLSSWETRLGANPLELTVHGDSVTVRTTTAGRASVIPRVDGWLFGPNFLGIAVQPVNPTPRLTGSYTFAGVDTVNDVSVTGTLDVLDTATTVVQGLVPSTPTTWPPDGARLLRASGTIQRCTRTTGVCGPAGTLFPNEGSASSTDLASRGLLVDTLGVIHFGFYYSPTDPHPCPPQTPSGGAFGVRGGIQADTIRGDFVYQDWVCAGSGGGGAGHLRAVR